MSASPTVVAGEIPITPASAIEESQRPPLSVIAPGIRVLRSMAPTVSLNGHTLAPSCAGATLVSCYPCRGWAALAALQPLGSGTLPRELGQGERGTQGPHQTHTPQADKVENEVK